MQGMRIDATAGECLIYTFKEGLLSRIAHDLRIRAERFDIEIGDTEIVGRFDTRGLRVVTAMKDGQPNERALSGSDRAKIEETMRGEVLEVGRFPEVAFRAARPAGWVDVLDGELTLKGRTRPVRIQLARAGARMTAKTKIDQTDFGMKPYTAMLGTLRIQSRIEIELAANLPADLAL
jgi:hypothetical protein